MRDRGRKHAKSSWQNGRPVRTAPTSPAVRCGRKRERVPGGVGAFRGLERKLPFLWLHSRFHRPTTTKYHTLQMLEAARSPATCPVLCPGRDGTVRMTTGDGHLIETRLTAALPDEAAAYWRQLLKPLAVRLLQAHVRDLARATVQSVLRSASHLRATLLLETTAAVVSGTSGVRTSAVAVPLTDS